MKVLLTTIAIGDNYLAEYKNLFYNSQKNYALKHGYDFKVITDFLDKNIKEKSTISFNKILVCSQEWSNAYDFIICIDADILINENSPPIHNYIDYGNCIGIINEYSQPSKERRLNIQRRMGWETSATDYYKLSECNIQTDKVLNTGVLVLQPKIHGDFLKNIYDKYVRKSILHKRGFHFEQSCIGYELQKENLYKVILPFFGELNGKYNGLLFKPHFSEKLQIEDKVLNETILDLCYQRFVHLQMSNGK
jgi:hypothetical protein